MITNAKTLKKTNSKCHRDICYLLKFVKLFLNYLNSIVH